MLARERYVTLRIDNSSDRVSISVAGMYEEDIVERLGGVNPPDRVFKLPIKDAATKKNFWRIHTNECGLDCPYYYMARPVEGIDPINDWQERCYGFGWRRLVHVEDKKEQQCRTLTSLAKKGDEQAQEFIRKNR